MKRYRVVIAAGPQGEIAETVAYITEHGSPAAAERWLDELGSLLADLAEMPERFEVAREDAYFPSGTLRRALHHSHRVLFTIEPEIVRVLHVRHGMRDELTKPLGGGIARPRPPSL